MFAVLSGCRVEVEESVWLPFKTTAQLPEDTLIEWWHRPEKPDKQERDYRDRVKMKDEYLKSRQFSLTFKRSTERDSGRYSCVAWSHGHVIG